MSPLLPSRLGLLISAVVASWIVASVAHAQPGITLDPLAKPVADTPVVAKVGDQPIFAGEVDRLLEAAQAQRPVAERLVPQARAQILEELVKARLVERFLVTQAQVLTPGDIDTAVAKFQKLVGSEPEAFETYLKNQGLTPESLRDRVAFGIGWPLYARRKLTPEALEKQFNDARSQYDGTQLRVRQILIVPDNRDDPASWARARAVLERVRSTIVDGEITFEAAAGQFSEAPSRTEGGDIGLIDRHGDVPDAVAEAAFALSKDEISPVVESNFGLHLLQVTESQPGDKTWQDVRPELIRDLSRQLFNTTAAEERTRTPVEYTGQGPYVDETGKLVVPTQD